MERGHSRQILRELSDCFAKTGTAVHRAGRADMVKRALWNTHFDDRGDPSLFTHREALARIPKYREGLSQALRS